MTKRGIRDRGTGIGHRAFTLIELLVVVAIIAVLISILLPSLSLARKQAKQLLCNTRLAEMGKAALTYAAENNDWIVRAEGRFNPNDPRSMDLHFASILLPGLAYDGKYGPYWDLWHPARSQVNFAKALVESEILQCPSFPVPTQALDYVANAFPIPYSQRNISYDVAGGGQGNQNSATRTENQLAVDSIGFFNLTKFPFGTRPADLVYITEGHATLPSSETNPNFELHDTFLTSQLPFGAFPRMSNDDRHPGGTNAMFFDGHAVNMSFKHLDVGWPNPIGQRLRYFTVTPEAYW